MKDYIGHVQFDAISVRVRAKNLREAKKKIRQIALKKKHKIDMQNFFVDDHGWV